MILPPLFLRFRFYASGLLPCFWLWIWRSRTCMSMSKLSRLNGFFVKSFAKRCTPPWASPTEESRVRN